MSLKCWCLKLLDYKRLILFSNNISQLFLFIVFFAIRAKNETSPEYKNCFCAQHVKIGSAKLEFDDADIVGNKIIMILIVFQETERCEVNQKTGETGVGEWYKIVYSCDFKIRPISQQKVVDYTFPQTIL